MINYKAGDVVLTEVFFAEKNIKKKRPAVILSNKVYNSKRNDIIIAAITSNIVRVLYGDTIIIDWERAGLLYPSLAAGIIQTIKSNMIIRKLGTLTEKDFKKIMINIKKSLVL